MNEFKKDFQDMQGRFSTAPVSARGTRTCIGRHRRHQREIDAEIERLARLPLPANAGASR